MAFDDVTLFEVHLNDARFGGETTEESEPEPASGRRLRLVAFVLLGVGAAVAARWLRRGTAPEVDLEDAEAIAVE